MNCKLQKNAGFSPAILRQQSNARAVLYSSEA
jgi:hypothetical protein